MFVTYLQQADIFCDIKSYAIYAITADYKVFGYIFAAVPIANGRPST